METEQQLTFRQYIMAHSVSDNYDDARSEWQLMGNDVVPHKTVVCPCNRKITHVVHYTNPSTRSNILCGAGCANHMRVPKRDSGKTYVPPQYNGIEMEQEFNDDSVELCDEYYNSVLLEMMTKTLLHAKHRFKFIEILEYRCNVLKMECLRPLLNELYIEFKVRIAKNLTKELKQTAKWKAEHRQRFIPVARHIRQHRYHRLQNKLKIYNPFIKRWMVGIKKRIFDRNAKIALFKKRQHEEKQEREARAYKIALDEQRKVSEATALRKRVAEEQRRLADARVAQKQLSNAEVCRFKLIEELKTEHSPREDEEQYEWSDESNRRNARQLEEKQYLIAK